MWVSQDFICGWTFWQVFHLGLQPRLLSGFSLNQYQVALMLTIQYKRVLLGGKIIKRKGPLLLSRLLNDCCVISLQKVKQSKYKLQAKLLYVIAIYISRYQSVKLTLEL